MYGKHDVDCVRLFPDCPCVRCARDNAWDRRGGRCCGMRVCGDFTVCDGFRAERPDVIGRPVQIIGYAEAMESEMQMENRVTDAGDRADADRGVCHGGADRVEGVATDHCVLGGADGKKPL